MKISSTNLLRMSLSGVLLISSITVKANEGNISSVSNYGVNQTFSSIYQFGTYFNDGTFSSAALVSGGDGNLYGTTMSGGLQINNGTIFRITERGKEIVIYSFKGYPNDGCYPHAALVLGSGGSLYGTTSIGGRKDHGTVFRISPNGEEKIRHSFDGTSSDGATPLSAVLSSSDGTFYGTTTLGGKIGAGTIFKITPDGKETVLHSFNGDDGF